MRSIVRGEGRTALTSNAVDTGATLATVQRLEAYIASILQ